MIESTKAFQQFANNKSWAQLDFQTQQQIRLFAILEQAATKYGVDVGNNAISATARFTAQLNNLKLAIGQAFLPIWEAVLPGLTSMVTWLTRAANAVAQFMQVLFGKTPTKMAQSQANVNTQVASSMDSVGESFKKAGKEATKANKAFGSVAGFDEINTLAEKATSSGSGSDSGGGADIGDAVGGMANIPPIDFETNAPQISEKIREMAEKVRGFFSGLKSFMIENKDIIISALAGIGAGLIALGVSLIKVETIKKAYTAVTVALSNALKVLKAAGAALLGPIGLIVTIVAALTAAFVYFYRTNDKFKGFVDGIFNKIKDAALFLWQNVIVPFGEWLGKQFVAAWEVTKVAAEQLWKNVLIPFGDWLSKAFVSAWDSVKKASEWLWRNVLVPFGEFLKYFWNNILIPIGNVLKDVLATAFKIVADVAKSLWTNVLVPLGEFFKAVFGPTVEAVSAVITYLWKNAIAPLGKYLAEVFIVIFTLLTKTIETLWNKVLKPLVPFLTDVLTKAFETVGSMIKGLQKTFIGLMDFITGVFTNDWEKAWNGVKDIFKGVFESLYGFVKTPLNMIIDAINAVISGLNSISIDIPDWVPKYGGQKFGISIPRIPKLARGGIVDTTTNMGNYIAGEAGSEMIVPLENTSFVDKLASALGTAVMSAMSFSNESASNKGDFILQIDGVTLGRVMNPYLTKENNRVGTPVIKTI